MDSVRDQEPEELKPWWWDWRTLFWLFVLAAVGFVVSDRVWGWPSGGSPTIRPLFVEELYHGEPVSWSIDGQEVLVVQRGDGEILAFSAIDPLYSGLDSECLIGGTYDFDAVGDEPVSIFRSCLSTYDLDGVLLEGPSPRGMDRYAVEVRDGRVYINTSVLYCGPPFETGEVCDTGRLPALRE